MSTDAKRFIYVENGNKVVVGAIGILRLNLGTVLYLDLEETFIVPSLRRNLILISCLDKSSYFCSFGNRIFRLFQNSNKIGTDSLIDKFYTLDIKTSYDNENMHVSNYGTKPKLTNEISSML